MNFPKLIRQAIVGFPKRTWLLPQSVAIAVERRRRQVARNELEAERLDRLRNPHKYLGT